ncbi:MAG: tetratricopeptide repeat protein [Nevskiaceae bacterium]|jgi:tetratricopeptide (TPR) repeat protein|nr:tetratricopeptide repeat protein [Nevskiaceae bacterium]
MRGSSFKTLCVALLWAGVVTPVCAQVFDYDDRRPQALSRCDDPSWRGREADARSCYQALLRDSEDVLVRAEANWALGNLQPANDLFRQAVAANPRGIVPRLRWGRLFMGTSQYSDAAKLFQEALEIDEKDKQARVAMARLTAERFVGDAKDSIDELLKEDDTLLEAHLVAARLAIENGDLAQARREAQRALDLAQKQKRPPLEAWTMLAAAEVVANRNPDRWVRAALNYNPRYGQMFETLGTFEVVRRRYREADAWYARAIEVQPDLWSAQRERGLNMLRLGDRDGARTHLERAYGGDRFSTATVNTLRLLDSLDQFESIDSSAPALHLQLHRSEAAALSPYVQQLSREAIATFSQRYGWTPTDPVTVEMYPDHDDFAVRTAGLPGIGLLGVTFGHVVAMDSPAGRKSGDFHWGSTLWHELAHVFTLSATDHRVPRWLSEGLSVFEEWTTGPTPGVNIEPPTLDKFIKGELLPIATLDEGFIRPSYENQVQVSYQQAGLTALYMAQRWGMPKIVEFLHAFDGNVTTAEAVKRVFDIAPEDFDKDFTAFLNERFKNYVADPERWLEQLRAANAAAEKQDWAAAKKAATEAITLLPEYTNEGSAYIALAAAEEGSGNRDGAIAALESWRKAGGWDPAGLRKLGALLLAAGRKDEATVVLAAVNYADPLAQPGHAQLGQLLLDEGDNADALREYQVLLALAPLDASAAHFGMARAYRGLGDEAKARRNLLQALETAPHLRPAQQMLLEMTGNTQGNQP